MSGREAAFAWVPPTVLEAHPGCVVAEPDEARCMEVPDGWRLLAACGRIRGRAASLGDGELVIAHSGGRLALGRADQFDFEGEDGDALLFRAVWLSLEPR